MLQSFSRNSNLAPTSLITKGISMDSTYVTQYKGGYCKIGKVVLVNMQILLKSYSKDKSSARLLKDNEKTY